MIGLQKNCNRLITEGKSYGGRRVFASEKSILMSTLVRLIGSLKGNLDKKMIREAEDSYKALKEEFREAMFGILAAYQRGEITDEVLEQMWRGEIKDAWEKAYMYGVRSVGNPFGIWEEDKSWIAGAEREEFGYLGKFVEDIKNNELVMSLEDRLNMYVETLDGVFNHGKVDGSPEFVKIHWVLKEAKHCISGDSFISSNLGLKKIGNLINCGVKKVYSSEGVVNCDGIIKRSGKRFVKEIVTYHGFSLKATGEHEIEVYRDGLIKWVNIDNIKLGDWVVLKRGFLFNDNEGTEEDEMLGEILGIFDGNGWYSHPKLRKRKNGLRMDGGQCGFVINSKDKDVVERIIEILERFKIRKYFRVRDCGNVIRIDAGRKGYIKLRDFNLRTGSIPDCVFELPLKGICGYLRGVFSTDGTVLKNVISLSNKSEKFIKEIQILLLSLGILSKIKCEKNKTNYTNGNERVLWHLKINGGRNKDIFMDLVGFINKRQREKVKKELRNFVVYDSIPDKKWFSGFSKKADKKLDSLIRQKNYGISFRSIERLMNAGLLSEEDKAVKWLKNGYFFDKVEKIIDCKEPIEVYDVLNCSNRKFIANGFSVHNCDDCIRFAAGSPYTKKNLPAVPKNGTSRCLSACKCELRFEYADEKPAPEEYVIKGPPKEPYVPKGYRLPTDKEADKLGAMYAEIERLRGLIKVTSGDVKKELIRQRRDINAEMIDFMERHRIYWTPGGQVQKVKFVESIVDEVKKELLKESKFFYAH